MVAIHDHGSIKNTFGILNNDLSKVQPGKLREFVGKSMSPGELADKLSKPRGSMYKDTVKLPREFIEDKLIPVVVASDLACELFENNQEEARIWMLTPNSYFFGKSPFNKCLLGEGEAVIEFLAERLGIAINVKEKIDKESK